MPTRTTAAAASTPQRRRRRTAEQTRELLLRAGTELALRSLDGAEAGDGGPLAHIRVLDVVKEASRLEGVAVTSGALYHLWSTQQEFQVDLMFHLLRAGAYPAAAGVRRLASELFAQRLPPAEIVARLSDESFRIESESRMGKAATAFVALSSVPAVREALRDAHHRYLDEARELFSQILTYIGLEMRPPYTLDQLATVMGAVNDGLRDSASVVPELHEVPAGAYSIAAAAARGVFSEFCRPVVDNGDAIEQ